MDKIAEWKPKERAELFELVASERGISPTIIEKDFWVCWILGRLFADIDVTNRIIFKGGTTLSKIFGVIERFSEDIDLILDWSNFVPEPVEKERSRSQQDTFNKETNSAAQDYLKQTLVPKLEQMLEPYCKVSLDEESQLVVNVRYPLTFEEHYIRREIILETGPLASREPHGEYLITPYAAETSPEQFEVAQVKVKAITAERTFWEKATILHAEAHRPEDKPLRFRYSRHYYDLMFLAQSKYRRSALDDLGLMARVVEFKDRFYHQAWANYQTAVPGTFRLIPPEHVLKRLVKDYVQMQVMIFGVVPEFKSILGVLKELEDEINDLS